MNRRKLTLIQLIAAAVSLVGIWTGAWGVDSEHIATHLEQRNLPPSLQHVFGTDWLGRDMFVRTIKGLAVSMGVGLIAAVASAAIAVLLGLMAAMGKHMDRVISWVIDLFLSVPHLVTLILIAYVVGGGAKGIIIGIALTHWPSLARVIRAEVMQLRSTEYVQAASHLGSSRLMIAIRHIGPHLIPQVAIGLLLIFPHAILHEAAITFLGMGLSPHEPAIGIILSESMRYLSLGLWWLAFFPGLCLLLLVKVFDMLGENVRLLMDPNRSEE